MDFTCIAAGDRAVLIQFKQEISEEINRKVIKLAHQLEQRQIAGVEEWVPSYCTLMVYYNPVVIGYDKLVHLIKELDTEPFPLEKTSSTIHEIPVLYGGEYGPDLKDDFAKYNQLSVEEVIYYHSNPLYYVYMIGFSPGFPYLGGLDSRLHTPRLDNPRLRIKPGSVGIAGEQTGIYTLPTPGGWRVIGHTPIPLFQPENEENPTLISAGDKIKFVPVTIEEYELFKTKHQQQHKEVL